MFTVNWNNWASQEPNDWGNGEDCVAIDYNRHGMNDREGKWNDIDCQSSQTVVCEKDSVFGDNMVTKNIGRFIC